MSKIKPTKAFTLLEVVVVIIIVGALTSLALPRLFDLVRGAKAMEAISMFASIRSGLERCALMNNGSYLGCCNGTTENGTVAIVTWGSLGMDNPNLRSKFFYQVGVPVEHPESYLIVAAYNVNFDYNPEEGEYACPVADCSMIVMGLGIRCDKTEDPVFSLDCTNFLDDGKIYWAGDDKLEAFLPKTH
jgi:prepilin-type N-terminal cleavage/methylation domain-containing protein